MSAEIRFEELLQYNEEETNRWMQWFAAHPEALDAELDLTTVQKARDVLFHIFGLELWYAEWIPTGAMPSPELFKSMRHDTIEDLLAIAGEARQKFREFIRTATDSDWAVIVAIPEGRWGKLQPSRRKAFMHVMVHGIRHWAQVATALRKVGMKDDGRHDFLFTNAID
jgi:uncharacterized damage-inducible protein DinB